MPAFLVTLLKGLVTTIGAAALRIWLAAATQRQVENLMLRALEWLAKKSPATWDDEWVSEARANIERQDREGGA